MLRARTGTEDDVRANIQSVCTTLGYDVRLSYATDAGPCDIYLPNRRVIIETKAPGSADPHGPGSQPGETQFGQCARYIRAEHNTERIMLGFDPSSPWRGFLTDGSNWWCWEWQLDDCGDLIEPDVDAPVDSRSVAGEDDAVDAVRWLHRATSQEVGRPWVPDDLSALSDQFKEAIRKHYGDLKHATPTETKHGLWLEMLEASGFAPNETEADELFVRHTVLISVARAVVLTLEDPDAKRDAYYRAMSDGFASWLLDTDPATNEPSTTGAALADRIFTTVASYDWRRRGRDVLRHLYEHLIDAKHRESYGEYYTPDWLAAAVVEEVLDDDWIASLVESYDASGSSHTPGVGVLDPACGSGTFLFHAAEHIANATRVKAQQFTPVELADFLANAVNGVDLHPVAVELSRATLLRALPVIPSGGTSALRVFQGDSLMWKQRIGFGPPEASSTHTQFQGELALTDDDSYTTQSHQHRVMRFPFSFVADTSFGTNVDRLVRAASELAVSERLRSDISLEDIPRRCVRGLNQTDTEILVDTFRTLIEVIAGEGNSVWGWYLRNAAASPGLHMRKIDRIVANPPWVRMSKIQVTQRKTETEELAKFLGVWGTGTANTSIDVAGLFVARCHALYQASDRPVRAGWVLPWGALDGSHWKKVRELEQLPGARQYRTAEWDLSKVKRPPFPQSQSCVWITSDQRPDQLIRSTLENVGTREITTVDQWSEVRQQTRWAKPKRPAATPSHYAASRDGSCAFQNGATLFPLVLVKVRDVKSGATPDVCDVSTTPSQNEPWSRFRSQRMNIPTKMIFDVVTAKDDLLTFATRPNVSQFILPVAPTGELMTDMELRRVHSWNNIASLFHAHRGKGADTPKALAENLNYHSKLTAQTMTKRRARKVVYNASGGYVRAARVRHDLVVNHNCFWFQPSSAPEGAYLTSMLNARCLQDAYRSARNSDRDFLQHIWRSVPIPRFDKRARDHLSLADLCSKAERVAKAVAADPELSSAGQVKITRRIHAALDDAGIRAEIDDVVRRILPDHTT